MQQPERHDVVVIGGGLGGLALAAGLTRRGYDAHVYEAAPELRTATSTLIGLGGNAFIALDDLHPNLVPQLKEQGALCRRQLAITKPSKHTDASVDIITPERELYTIRWAVVQNVLAGVVPPEVVHCGYRCTGYTEDPETGLVAVHFKDKPDVHAKLLVGADGVKSSIRSCMVPYDSGPRYLGHMNWNALLYNPGGCVVDAHCPGDLKRYVNVPLRSSGQMWTLYSMVIDAGGGYTFWQVRSQSDRPSFTQDPNASPASDGFTIDAYGAVDGDSSPPHMFGGGLGKPGSKARVEQILMDAGWDDVLKVVQATPESAIFERAMMDRIPLDELGSKLSSQGGRVVLLGDAAHAMHSGPGQGGRTAFEDAHTLMRLLEQHRPSLHGWHDAAGDVKQFSRAAAVCPKSTEHVQSLPADIQGLSKVLQGYNHARLVRVCRVQRAAAEGCGLESIRRAVFPHHLTTEQLWTRYRELGRWMDHYPDLPDGDPTSTYWKPSQSGSHDDGDVLIDK